MPSPWLAAAVALFLYLTYRFLAAIQAPAYALWLYAVLVAVALLQLLRSLWAALRRDRLLRLVRQPAGVLGMARLPSAHDAEAMGLKLANPDGNGIPLGGVGRKIIHYDGPGHLSIRAPTNAGKTESSSALIGFALGRHRNLIVTAKGAELVHLVAGYRRDVLGQQIIIIDPFRLLQGSGFKTHSFNPLGHLVRLAAARSAELIDKARAIILMVMPEPQGGAGQNAIFLLLGRDLAAWVLIHLAIREAETGELCCNLAYLYQMLSGSNADLMILLQEMRRSPDLGGSIARAADRFLGRLERSPKLAESVLADCQASLQLYDPAGPLGDRIDYSEFNPADLKDPARPTSVFIVVPPEKMTLYGAFVGLCLNTLVEACIEADRFAPRVTVVADEFASLGVLPCALPTLYLGRSRGVQLVSYVQDIESYSRYGKEASAFTTQSEVTIAWGIRSTRDAEDYSKRSGQRSIMAESIGLPREGHQAALSLGEKAVPNLRPDELLQLPAYTAVVFHKQNPAILVDLVSYRAIEPWRYQAGPVPGAPPLQALPVKYRA